MTDSKTVVEDLAAWLTAVWDEEERLATKAGGDRWILDGGIVHESHPSREVVDWVYDEADEHIAYHDPARVLARIAADRKILALHIGPHDCTVLVTGTYPDDWPEYIPWGKAGTEWRHPSNEYFEDLYCPTARHLAESHKDRPGFRPEWLVERQGVEG